MPPTPLVSILIPNFNNGRTSSLRGDRDFLGDLLRSIETTLAGDPTPFEVLIADDGSTDDSLETARSWARRLRPDGQPFCRLIELPHCGVLSKVLNRLMREARGRYFFRLDGDIVIHTPRWVEALCGEFDRLGEDVGVIGPLQLIANGRVHAAGDWLIHPRGYHHVAQGASPADLTESFEVDHIMGCFHAMRREVYETVGDYDESILRGQTEDYGVRTRLADWRAFFTPAVSFTHFHSDRGWRDNTADNPDSLASALDRFRTKWGFDRLCPDLDEVRRRYAGTGLLWRDRARRPSPDARWARFAADSTLQHQCASVAEAVAADGARRVIELNAGDGLMAHLLGLRGLQVIAVERSMTAVADAIRFVGQATYPAGRPEIVQTPDERGWAHVAGGAPLVLISNLERHPNPIAAIQAAAKLLSPTGCAIVTAVERATPLDSGPEHRFRAHELNSLLANSRHLEITQPALSGSPSGLLLSIARRAGPSLRLNHFSQPSLPRRAAG